MNSASLSPTRIFTAMDANTVPEFQAGDHVQLIRLPSYVKTAESMPMLRPPDVLTLGEVGVILARKPGNFWAVRLGRGAFLLESQYLAKVEAATSEL